MPGTAPRPSRELRVRPTPAGRGTVPPAVEAKRRIRGLLDAHRTIASDLCLADKLECLVTAACELVGTRCGAISVTARDGSTEWLSHHGMDEQTVARVAALQTGAGARTAASDDPALDAFRKVAVRVRGEDFGTLYLSQPEGRRFTEDDEELVTALAALAATAVANARLLEDARRSRNWLQASGEIARALLADADADADALLDVIAHALHVAEADYSALVLPAADGRLLKVAVAFGVGAEKYDGLLFDPKNSRMAKAMSTGASVLVDDIADLARADFDNDENFGPVVVAPLVDAKGVRGAVLLVRTADHAPFTTQDLDLATTFADQVTLALDLDDTRTDAEQLRMLELRHRVTEDLHDSVIQRLFGTGMGLQGLAKSTLPASLADRLGRHISDLDETIDEIRGRVLGLRDNAADGAQRLRSRFPRVLCEDADTPAGRPLAESAAESADADRDASADAS